MFEVERLVELGLFSQMIPVWQVFFFIAAILPFLFFNRVRLCMLITYLFTFYLGFMVQWGEYLASTGSLFPFFLYVFSGIFLTVIFVVLLFRDETGAIRLASLKRSAPVLRPFEPEDDAQYR